MIDGIGRNTPAWLAVSTSNSAGPRSVGRADPGALIAGSPAAMPQFGALVRAMAASPPIDTARVAALRAAIVSGAYTIDPEAIATRMLAFDRSGRG